MHHYQVLNLNGENVNVYVLDTGINRNHAEFIGRIGEGKNFVNDNVGLVVLYFCSYESGTIGNSRCWCGWRTVFGSVWYSIERRTIMIMFPK